MTTVTNTFQVLISAQPDAVFAYVSDLTRHGEWNSGLRIEAVTSGPAAMGSQYRSFGEVAGQKNRPNELRVTRYEPPARFAFVAKDPDFKEVTHEFTFRSQNGGTLLERVVTVELSPLFAIAFRAVISPLIGKPAMDKALASLKAKLEQRVG
jgi:uncharacterized protein YndB with AHSA1/START domain